MAQRGYVGAKFYNLGALTGHKKVFIFTADQSAVVTVQEFIRDDCGRILDQMVDYPYYYVEPENSTKH